MDEITDIKFDGLRTKLRKIHCKLEKNDQIRADYLTDSLYYKGTTDSIGLFYKSYYEEKLEEFENELDLVFIMSDIDKFGQYNKDYGHPQGDLALKRIAKTFKNSIEKQLISPENSFVTRYGGEEFCAFIANWRRGVDDLDAIVETVRQNIESLEIECLKGTENKNDGYKHRTITIAGSIRKKYETIEKLVNETDKFLTLKDKFGRNRSYLRERDRHLLI